MNLPMSWDEWADHDGVALATGVAKGELTASELLSLIHISEPTRPY